MGVSTDGSIDDIKDRIREKKKDFRREKEFRQQEETDYLIMRAASRPPGARVSYGEMLAERHAFASRGVYDIGLTRHSDPDLADAIYRSSPKRNPQDVIKDLLRK